MDVAWLAMRVHVGRQQKGNDVIDVEGEEEAPSARKRKAQPPPPKGTRMPPPPPSTRPRVWAPPRSGRHGTG